MIATWTVLHKIAKKLGLSFFVYHCEFFFFKFPFSVKTIILDFRQLYLAMGSNGNVATVIPDEGDCLVFCEWPSQGITSLIVSFMLCCG